MLPARYPTGLAPCSADMNDIPVALAVAAGAVAALNPCGFALLPAYLSILVADDRDMTWGLAVGRALAATAAMTAGFAIVFGVFGLALTPIADAVQSRLPLFTIVFGLLLAALGGWLLAGRDLPGLGRWLTRGPAVTRSAVSMAVFGGAYALVSLSCTIGPFLAVVVSTLRADTPVAGIVVYAAYAIGMGMAVGTVALAVVLARTAAVHRLRRFSPVAARAGGVIMLAAGIYVAYYGWYDWRVLHGGDPADPVVGAAGSVQVWLTNLVDHAGVTAIAAAFAIMASLAAALIWSGRRRRRTQRSESP